MPEIVTLPSNLSADLASSSIEDRRRLVAEICGLIQGGKTRDEVIATIVAGGRSAEFAAWIYTKVKYYVEVEIGPPLETQGRAMKRSPLYHLAKPVVWIGLVIVILVSIGLIFRLKLVIVAACVLGFFYRFLLRAVRRLSPREWHKFWQ